MANFTLLIIGDEILSGRRQDQHFSAILQRLQQRGHTLNAVLYLADNSQTLVETFQRTLAQGLHVISCGGIGATPDDYTRAALATALNRPLCLQAQAAQLIEQRFGSDAYPHRIKMAEFPEGAAIIPNPINQVAGGSIQNHYLLPGFPSMAWPMVDWLLDEYYETAPTAYRQSITVLNAKEGDLITVMQELVATWPRLAFSSLPSFGNSHCAEPHIEFSLQGEQAEVTLAMDFLSQKISELNYILI